MSPKRQRLFLSAGLGVCWLIAACGGGSKTAPTPVTGVPQIACPATPDPVESLDGSAQVVSFPAPTVTGGQAPLNTSCVPVSGSSFTIGTTTVTCTTNDARARTATCSFPVEVLPPPKLAVTSFLAFGDSITYGEDGTSPPSVNAVGQRVFVQLVGETYPELLQGELQTRYRQQSPSVTNAGNAGESLSDGLSMDCEGGPPEQSGAFIRYVQKVSSGQYDALLLMDGSNDVDGAPGDSCLVNKAIGVLRRITEDAHGRGMPVIVATIPPMVPPGAFGRAKGYQIVPSYDDLIRALATSENVPLADVYAAFGSDAPTLIGFDGLHPNSSGYQRIADTFLTAIKSSLETPRSAGSQAIKRR